VITTGLPPKPGAAGGSFPYLEGATGAFGQRMPSRERLALTGMLARLHGATAVAGDAAPVRGLAPASLPGLRAGRR